MAIRKRMIQPTIWQDTDFGSLSSLAKLIFIGFITLADDEGRLRADPRLIKNQLFPYDLELTIEMVFDAVEEIKTKCKNVLFYANLNDVLCQFSKWKTHQILREDRMQKSILPPPSCGQSAAIRGEVRADDGEVRRSAAQVKGSKVKRREIKEREGKGKGGEDAAVRGGAVISILDGLRKELEAKGIIKKGKLL